jgi:hypothetical protein
MDCEFRKQPINYWWFRIHTQPIQQFIDISHSTFRNKSKEVITIPIENYLQEDYPLQAITWLDNHWINELSIHKDIEQYDMFCLRHFSSLYIVSERLKEAIEKHKFKGMTFQEATWLKII